MRARKMLNVLVLLTMALGLIAAPTSSVSAEVTAGITYTNLRIDPPNAKAGAHWIFWFHVADDANKILFDWPAEVDVPNMDFPEGSADLEKITVSWAQDTEITEDQIYDTDNPDTIPFTMTAAYGGVSDSVHPVNTQWGEPGDPFIPERELRLQLDPTNHPKDGYWVRVDFWGPSSVNPDHPNAGISNPQDPDPDFCMDGWTDEEDDPYGVFCYPIEPPFAVRLYRKYQIPTYSCGYNELQYIGGFTEIQPALDAAKNIWLNAGEYTEEEMWNLFADCPTIDQLIDAGGDPLAGEGRAEFLDAIVEGVPVGALIVVDADARGPGGGSPDGIADVYTGTLIMETPGVILGSRDNIDDDKVDRPTIEAGSNWPKGDLLMDRAAGVAIQAGGISFGASDIQLIVGDALLGDDETDGVFRLGGFIVQNAGVGDVDDPLDLDGDTALVEELPAHGISVDPLNDECLTTDVFDFALQEWTVLSYTYNYTIAIGGITDTLVLYDQSGGIEPWTLDTSVFGDGDKLVNLTTGWNGHILQTSCVGTGYPTADLCVKLLAGEPDDNAIEINLDRFQPGNAIAVFGPTTNPAYECEEARVDIRENDVLNSNNRNSFLTGPTNPVVRVLSYGNGISAYSVSVWVDGNNVYDNDGDGFYGDDLYCSGGVIVCDGMDRSDKLLELSGNTFEENGLVARDDWTGADDWGDECFYPEPAGSAFSYDDAGIKIGNVLEGESGALDDLYIHDNDILNNNATGIWLEAESAYCGIRILRNDIESNAVFGVSSWAEDHDMDRDVLTGPDMTDYFEPTMIGTGEVDVIFKYNDVTGNGLWGVKNWAFDYDGWGDLINEVGGEGGPMFNAKENYWNFEICPGPPEDPQCDTAPGGPSAGPQPCAHDYDQRSGALGFGDAVNKGTFYNPWLAVNWEALLDVETQGMRAYGSDSLYLQAGWNTLAVPIAVDDNYDTVGEILDLGTFLKNADGEQLVERIYEFDNTGMGWQQNPALDSLHGYYIKINPDLAPEGTRFPVIYNVERGSGLPSYDLLNNETTGGWNLIGSGFGIDKDWDNTCREIYLDDCQGCDEVVRIDVYTDLDQGRYAIAVPGSMQELNGDFDDEAVKWAGEVLESVVWGDGFSNGASMVVNPGVPGQLEPFWARTVQDIFGSGNPDTAWMYTGEAYWVFMREDATLAGFEMTPLYLDYTPFPIPLR